MLLKKIFLYILIFSNSACLSNLWAQIPTHNTVGCFKKAFADSSEVYSEGECSTNIRNLILECFNDENKLDDARVLYLYSLPQSKIASGLYPTLQTLYPENTRLTNNEGWLFHVVLEYNGHIYDLDFTTKAKIVSTARYFTEMFHSSKKQILIRKIDARDYKENYSKSSVNGGHQFRYYLYDLEDHYLSVGFEDFFNKNTL